MGFPGIDDNDDKMVALLQQIAENTGDLDQPDRTINLNGQTADNRVGFIPANSFYSFETDDLDGANANGTVTLSPGDTAVLVEYDGKGALYAVGATDKQDVEYQLEIDNQLTGGRTNSPLGLINNPFSFVQMCGGAVPIEDKARYIASYSAGASGDITLAARMLVEVM